MRSERIIGCILTGALLSALTGAAQAEDGSGGEELAGTRRGRNARAGESSAAAAGTGDAAADHSSIFAPATAPNRPRSDIFMPLVSFILPGFDQWWEGQTTSAMAYSGIAAGGLFYAAATEQANDMEHAKEVRKKKREESGDDSKDADSDLAQKDIATRKYTLGMLVYQGAGGISAYHTFRTAVRTRKGQGQYDFLTHEETPLELFEAPFHFQYLARPTTYIPLLVGAAIAGLQMSSPPDKMERDKFRGSDAFFTATYSYNAGVHEEAIFRGYVMPVMREYWGSDFWSNAGQSVLFAAAHLNTNSFPLPQLLLGYHLGYVSQKNGWALGEGVFIHAWWDVMAFAVQYQYKEQEPDPKKAALIKPVLWLPPFEYYF